MNDVCCFSVTSIGDSASPCLIIHDRESSYVGWLAKDKVIFHWATHVAHLAKHSIQFHQHSFQRSNAFYTVVPNDGDDTPQKTTESIFLIKNFADHALLFLTKNEDQSGSVSLHSLSGRQLFRSRNISSWGLKADIVWFYSRPEEKLILHFVGNQKTIYVNWNGLEGLDLQKALIACDQRNLIILASEKDFNLPAASFDCNPALNSASSAFETEMLTLHATPKIILTLPLGSCDVENGIPTITQLSCRLLHIIKDELPYKHCPTDGLAEIDTSYGDGQCRMDIAAVCGVVPLGFVLDCGMQHAGIRLASDLQLPPYAQNLLSNIAVGIGGAPHTLNEILITSEYYKLVRFLAGAELTEATMAMEMDLLQELEGPIEISNTEMSQWLEARWPCAINSSRTMSRFFENLKEVWNGGECGARLEQALNQLKTLSLRKIEIPQAVTKNLKFSYSLYDQLDSNKAVYAYLHGRYDVLLGDGHWTLTSPQHDLESQLCNDLSKKRSSISGLDMWDALISESSNQNWNSIIRQINDLIASKIYKKFEIPLGQNILKTQNLQIPWSRLRDIGGFGFPWGRHGALNRLDLYMDLFAAYLNAGTQISPERMTSLFHLRSYPEVAALTKLFIFSHNENSTAYKNIINRAFTSEFNCDGLDLASSQADVIIGTMWNVLRHCYYLSGTLLGYGMVRSSHSMKECYAEVEDVLNKLMMRTSKTTHPFIANNGLSENSVGILDHALNYTDEADWFHDDLDDKKSPAVNQLLISLIFSTALTNQLGANQIMEILFGETAHTCAPENRRRSRAQEQLLGGELLLRIHKKHNLSLLDGALYLASALTYDRSQTTSMLMAHRIIIELDQLMVSPHTNIDTTVADCYDLKIDGSGLSWYKKLHNDSMQATKRQGLLLGAGVGIHLGYLADDNESDVFKAKCLELIIKAYNTKDIGDFSKVIVTSTTLAPANRATLRPLLEGGLMLALGVGFLNWRARFPSTAASLSNILFDAKFSLRDPECIFYRALLWCLWCWQDLTLDCVGQIFPPDLIEDSLFRSAKLPDSPLQHLETLSKGDKAFIRDDENDDFDESNCCVKAAIGHEKRKLTPWKMNVQTGILAAVCFALALKHTAQDDTAVTEFLLTSGQWLIDEIPDVSDACLILASMSKDESSLIGTNDTLKLFALNWIIASMGLSCAGTNDEIVMTALDGWSERQSKFGILMRVNSAKSMIKGNGKIREFTKFMNSATASEFSPEHKVDPQRLGLDILAAMPTGDHWGDNRLSLQLFDLFSDLWTKHNIHDLQHRRPVLHILSREGNTLMLTQHVDDEEGIYVTDPSENIQQVNTLRSGNLPLAAHYPGQIEPSPIKSARSSVLFLQRTIDI